MFGSADAQERVRDVVEIDLVSLNGKKRVKVLCFVVDDIA